MRPSSGSASRSWLAMLLAGLAIFGNYYSYDAIAPVADLLRSERGFTQSQIGLLNAVFSLPNIALALVGGILIDRIGASRTALLCAVFGFVGTVLTAVGEPYAVMVTGRLLFGIGEETLLVALLAVIAEWFHADSRALAMAIFFSTARIGSYLADISPSWASSVYAGGWQPPLWLAAALTALSLIAAYGLLRLESTRDASNGSEHGEPFRLSDLRAFDRSFWYILGLNVLFASVFFPFRSTFAIVYFQDVKGLSLADAGRVNSWVFFAAIFATPLFGAVADRFGHRAKLLVFGAALMPLTFFILGATNWSLSLSTVLMGVSFSVIPAVIWPSTTMMVERGRVGTAFGIINVLQSLGMFAANYAGGLLNDALGAGPANPAGYNGMLILLGTLSIVALVSTALLLVRESGPAGHGIERRNP